MTASPTSVVIRPPLLIRVYAIAFFAVWVGVLVSFVVKSHRVGSVLVNLGFLIIGGVIVGSVLTQSVTAFADGTLRIRNWLLGRQLLTRDTIAGFQVGTGLPAPGVQMIVVSTRDR